jgi:hypothetical protein
MPTEPSAHLSSEELALIQKVLSDEGYTGTIAYDRPADYNAAAKHLIAQIRRGITDQKELAGALVVAFGKYTPKAAIKTTKMHRNAIRGLLAKRGSEKN